MFRPGNLAANSPQKISNSPLKRFHVVRLLLSEVQTRTHSHFNQNVTTYARLKRSQGSHLWCGGAAWLLCVRSQSPGAGL